MSDIGWTLIAEARADGAFADAIAILPRGCERSIAEAVAWQVAQISGGALANDVYDLSIASGETEDEAKRLTMDALDTYLHRLFEHVEAWRVGGRA